MKPFFMHHNLLQKSETPIHFNNLLNQQIQVLHFFPRTTADKSVDTLNEMSQKPEYTHSISG